MTQEQRVWEKLNKDGSITAIEVMNVARTTCPHGVIRNLRERYGYNTITDAWESKTKKEYTGGGKEQKVTIRYKRYFLNKLEGIKNGESFNE